MAHLWDLAYYVFLKHKIVSDKDGDLSDLWRMVLWDRFLDGRDHIWGPLLRRLRRFINSLSKPFSYVKNNLRDFMKLVLRRIITSRFVWVMINLVLLPPMVM